LGFERNEYERRALHNAGVTLEEKLVVLFYRMDPTGRRFPDIVNIAMELKQGKLSYESEHLHSSASAKAPPSLPPRTSSRQSQRAKRTFDMEPSVSHQLRELFLKQCPRFTPEKMSSKVFMRLARKWGVMFDATNAVGELAFQKAATNVWKRKQIKKDKVRTRLSCCDVLSAQSTLILVYDNRRWPAPEWSLKTALCHCPRRCTLTSGVL